MTLTLKKSFCRICSACCGTDVWVDEHQQVVRVRGDKDDLMSSGYACIKGLEAPALLYAGDRILQPLKRQPDGSFAPIGFAQALDEVAARLRQSIETHGPESIAGFRGSGAVVNATAGLIVHNLLEAIGSHKSFSPYTIDQSAKNIAAGRLGMWPPGRDTLRDSDMRMYFGVNPLVSVLSSYLDMTNPTKRLKDAKARGMKLIVIDPRHTETAQFADLYLQPFPARMSASPPACCASSLPRGGRTRRSVLPMWRTWTIYDARSNRSRRRMWLNGQGSARRGCRRPHGCSPGTRGAAAPPAAPALTWRRTLIWRSI